MSSQSRSQASPAGTAREISLPEVADRLRGFGYDIDPPRAGDPGSGSVVARRDLGDHSLLVAVDAAGRIRAEITWLVGEWPSSEEIGGVPARIIDSVTRAVSITATVTGPEQAASFVAGLRAIVPWATKTADDGAAGASARSDCPP